MAADVTRIFSDIHFGDRASQVRRLAQIRLLTADTAHVVMNGDTLDTRSGPRPEHTAACRADILAFAQSAAAPITFLTGNHDPDISTNHWLELAGGKVLVLHGDVLFDEIVPWGRDARLIRRKIQAALGAWSGPDQAPVGFEERFRIWRAVAATIAQRHQSERNPLKYAAHFLIDTVWPPTRTLRIFRAWQAEPHRATKLVRAYLPQAEFVILGHTHRPSIRRVPGGPLIINTGSFTAPFGGYAVDLLPRLLRVRRIESHAGEFRAGRVLAEFPLAKP